MQQGKNSVHIKILRQCIGKAVNIFFALLGKQAGCGPLQPRPCQQRRAGFWLIKQAVHISRHDLFIR